jgi:uncharacterized protein
MVLRLVFISFLLLIAGGTMAQRSIPELWGVRVHDEAGVLSEEAVHSLESQLAQFQDSTTNQMAILIIPSLDGEVLEDYSLRVAEKWQLGQKGRDNGILILIAIQDRKMRIEVGYGLEGALPDATCAQIIRNEMAPNFRRGDYDAGVTAAVEAINRAIAGEYSSEDFEGAPEMELSWQEQVFMGLFVFGILGVFTFIGIFTRGCAGWFLFAFLIPFYATFPGAIFGWNVGFVILGVYLVGFVVLKLLANKMGWGKNWKMGTGSGGGWSSGSGWSSGGGSGWSSGASSFSGGGGSFGGGGSSGSW